MQEPKQEVIKVVSLVNSDENSVKYIKPLKCIITEMMYNSHPFRSIFLWETQF